MIKFALALILLSTSAIAATPDVCRPYAADIARTLQTYAWMRAYASCLSSDNRPTFEDRSNLNKAICLIMDCTPVIPTEATAPAKGPEETASIITPKPTSTPTQICTNAGKRIVWHRGKKGWRCR